MKALTGMKTDELEDLAAERGLELYRGRQLAQWIYRKGATSFQSMTDLPKEVREQLIEEFVINPLRQRDLMRHEDGTVKYLYELDDGQLIESVWLPHRTWETICVSTQVGCPIGCVFCASGRDFIRDLGAGEIVSQVLLAKRGKSAHVVFMGIGEPLLNRKELFRSLELLHDQVGIGARNMTISTVGIVQGIQDLANLGTEVNLGLSLHAPNDELRRRLIKAPLPPINELLKATRYFHQKTGRRISIEYVLLAGVNDLLENTNSLAGLLKSSDFQFHLNLIPYNEAHAGFQRPSPERLKTFRQRLMDSGINVTLRKERGKSIQAACGQLRLRSVDQ